MPTKHAPSLKNDRFQFCLLETYGKDLKLEGEQTTPHLDEWAEFYDEMQETFGNETHDFGPHEYKAAEKAGAIIFHKLTADPNETPAIYEKKIRTYLDGVSFIAALHFHRDGFHLEDSAHDIIFDGGGRFPAATATALDERTKELYALKWPDGECPCSTLLDLLNSQPLTH